jgi:hypothetical protein
MRDISRPNAPKWGIFFEESGIAGVRSCRNFPREMLLKPDSCTNYSGTGTGKGTGIGNPMKKGEL